MYIFPIASLYDNLGPCFYLRYLQTPGENLKTVITPETPEQFIQLTTCLKFIGFTDEVSILILYLTMYW